MGQFTECFADRLFGVWNDTPAERPERISLVLEVPITTELWRKVEIAAGHFGADTAANQLYQAGSEAFDKMIAEHILDHFNGPIKEIRTVTRRTVGQGPAPAKLYYIRIRFYQE